MHCPVWSYVMAAPANFYPTRTHLGNPGSTADMAPVVNDTMSTSTERLHRSGEQPPYWRRSERILDLTSLQDIWGG